MIGDVIIEGDVIEEHGKTWNNLDIWEVLKDIVRAGGEERMILGTKYFQSKIIALGGGQIDKLNDIVIPRDLVFLNYEYEQDIEGTKSFSNKVSMEGMRSSRGDIEVKGLVNGENLLKLNGTTALKYKAVTIKGNVIFNNTVTCEYILTVIFYILKS